MILRDILREIYYQKIKRMTAMEMRIDHLRRAGVTIGEDCWIFSDMVETAEPYLITIGNHVMISPGVMFTTHDASAAYYIPGASDLFGRINIGDSVYIGMGTIVLPGVTISNSVIVGAGCVVTEDLDRPGGGICWQPGKISLHTRRAS